MVFGRRLVFSKSNRNDNRNGKCTEKIIGVNSFDPVSKLQSLLFVFCVLLWDLLSSVSLLFSIKGLSKLQENSKVKDVE